MSRAIKMGCLPCCHFFLLRNTRSAMQVSPYEMGVHSG